MFRFFFAATNTDLLCSLLLSTDCSLYNVIKESCIIHPHSKNIMLKLSKLTEELLPRVLEFFFNLRLWSTQKANALSRQRLLVIINFNQKVYQKCCHCCYQLIYGVPKKSWKSNSEIATNTSEAGTWMRLLIWICILWTMSP